MNHDEHVMFRVQCYRGGVSQQAKARAFYHDAVMLTHQPVAIRYYNCCSMISSVNHGSRANQSIVRHAYICAHYIPPPFIGKGISPLIHISRINFITSTQRFWAL